MNTRYLPAIALAIANSLVQLGGVTILGWPAGNIFLLLWAENVIITLVAVGRMFGVRNAPDGGTGTKVAQSFGLLFFCFIHGIFSMTLARFTGLQLTMAMFVAPLILLAVRYMVEVIGWYARGLRPATLAQAQGFAIRRVVMLHVAIIACWFIMVGSAVSSARPILPSGPIDQDSPFQSVVDGLGGPAVLALVVLLTIKTVAEIASIRLGPNAPSNFKFSSS